jgi:hypothetical protein
MYATKESLQQHRNKVPHEEVKTDAGIFRCYGFTALELQRYRQFVQKTKNKDYLPAVLMRLGCRDENGKPMFTEEDDLWLIELGAMITEKVCNKILDLSGQSEGAIDDILKNLIPGLADEESESEHTTA